MKTFQFDDLTEPELIDLNHRIVERLRYLQQSRAHQAMLDFRIGDRVTFNPESRGEVTGMLTCSNRKTVTVITDDGHHWNVAPGFLKKVSAGTSRRLELVRRTLSTIGNVVPIKDKQK